MKPESGRRLTVASTVVALLVGIGLGAVILLTPSPQFGLHELAGLLLVVLLIAATIGAWASRAQDRRRPVRAVLGLAVLATMGVSGAALAVGALPASSSVLPAILLVALVGAMLETLRVSWSTAPLTGR